MRQEPEKRVETGRVIKALTGGLKIRIELLVKTFSLIPKIALSVVCISLALYVIQKLMGGLIYTPQASGNVSQSLSQLLTRLFYAFIGVLAKFLGALSSQAGISITSTCALIVVLVLVATVFSWRYAIIYAVASYMGSLVIGVLLVLATSVLGLGQVLSTNWQLGGGLASLFLFGFLEFLAVNQLMFNALLRWAGGQLTDLLFLAITMSAFGFMAMYVDKRAAIESSQQLLLPEIVSNPRISHQKKTEILEEMQTSGETIIVRVSERDLARYALLGGGIGVIVGALLLRHKTQDLGFLVWISVLTLVSMYVLGVASCG